MSLRLNITSLLAKAETAYATDPVATGAANAILIKGTPTLTPMEITSVQRDNMRPFFGNSEVLPSSIFGKLDFEVEAAGSGTAGVAPAFGVLLRGCGWSETLTAAAITGTAQAGGSATSIKLAAAASASDQFYNGMPISITAGTGNGQSGFIVNYDGTSKIATVSSSTWVVPDATSTYSIGANAIYRPISNSLESVATYMNVDGVLHKFIGARGNSSFSMAKDKIPSFKFSFQGIYVPVADSVLPTSVFTGWKQPKPVNKANTPFMSLHDYASAPFESFDFDLVNAIAHHNPMNSVEQFIITDRKPTGNISMEAVTVATKDWWSIVQNATLGEFALQHGTSAGNKLAITAPAMQIIAPKYGNSNNIAMLNAGLVPTPISGNDEITICTF